mmetsp:Transcript_12740/g.14175  ORF Transcript_12740/g.14175 Transcript_12740/m.14175 type:complete len:260 (+) Transcript_12740:87-866(+)
MIFATIGASFQVAFALAEFRIFWLLVGLLAGALIVLLYADLCVIVVPRGLQTVKEISDFLEGQNPIKDKETDSDRPLKPISNANSWRSIPVIKLPNKPIGRFRSNGVQSAPSLSSDIEDTEEDEEEPEAQGFLAFTAPKALNQFKTERLEKKKALEEAEKKKVKKRRWRRNRGQKTASGGLERSTTSVTFNDSDSMFTDDTISHNNISNDMVAQSKIWFLGRWLIASLLNSPLTLLVYVCKYFGIEVKYNKPRPKRVSP